MYALTHDIVKTVDPRVESIVTISNHYQKREKLVHLHPKATHINFICPMRFDNFPLDTQVHLIKKKIIIREG